MHAYRNPVHEEVLASLLLQAGFEHVSRSSSLAPTINLLRRAETAVADAYLAPLLSTYLGAVRTSLGSDSSSDLSSSLHLMTSAGGLVRAEEFAAKDSLLSGPAGGVVGASAAGRRAGFERVITFDMGGTSTDVARVDGDFEYVWQHGVGDVQLLAPALAIETVAAGGGSICTLDASGLRVGPESAGAIPGPACYGAGGPLTLTDCNLLLGRLDSASFGIPVSVDAARDALHGLLRHVGDHTGEEPAPEHLLAGLIAIAEERMADAIRSVSLRRGFDPTEYALVVFGGAGGQHGCGVARHLGIQTLIVPPDAGLLSAWGLGRVRLERIAQSQILRPLSDDEAFVTVELDRLGREAVHAVAAEGIDPDRVVIRRRIADLRYRGQDTSLAVDVPESTPLHRAFEDRYEAVYGHRPEPRPVEVESLRVIASAEPERDEVSPRAASGGSTATRRESMRTWLDDEWREVPIYRREELQPGDEIEGPCLVPDPYTAVLVDDGWMAKLDASGALVLTLLEPIRSREITGFEPVSAGAPEAVREQLFFSRFEALVSEMGDQLRRTAVSTNVKERLDFSCALLDPQGELVANAPHIPVHLGALGLCVRSVVARISLSPGDVAITNHPAYGGSHLPDVTVIAPVHTPD